MLALKATLLGLKLIVSSRVFLQIAQACKIVLPAVQHSENKGHEWHIRASYRCKSLAVYAFRWLLFSGWGEVTAD